MLEETHVADGDVSLANLSHEELVHMLIGLQADVEARDIIIATLQCEQNFLLVDDAKRHRYFIDRAFNIDLDDPILALQRDSHLLHTSAGPSVHRNVEHCRDGKGVYLEELLDNHRRTHAFYCEQLQAADQRYAALCASFEDEHKRLERDAAQGDDVVAMLEKEREKLQSELENERNQNKCLQKELKKALDSYAHQKALSQRQRIVAAQLIKEKHRLQKELSTKCAQIDHLECKLGLKSPLSSDRPVSVNVLAGLSAWSLRLAYKRASSSSSSLSSLSPSVLAAHHFGCCMSHPGPGRRLCTQTHPHRTQTFLDILLMQPSPQ
ncbi:hypothetical protein Aperf_G00000026808 [Anoplocephala perfoliata]